MEDSSLPDVDTYNRMVLKFASPFAKTDQTQHVWTLKYSLSGTAWTSADDCDGVADDLRGPLMGLLSTHSSYLGYLAYPPGSNINSYSRDVAFGTDNGTAAAYTSPDEAVGQQLEVCALAFAAAGRNSLGRPIFLTKHIHDVFGSSIVTGDLAAQDVDLTAWSTGLGTRDLVTVDPSTGTPSGAWGIRTALYTRQLRRGTKAPS